MSASWFERLKAAGAVDVIDILVLLGAGHRPSRGPDQEARLRVPFLSDGAALPKAHRAKGDVEGLTRSTNTCESMKSCLLSKNVAQPLTVWWARQQTMAVRAEWVKSQGREGAP